MLPLAFQLQTAPAELATLLNDPDMRGATISICVADETGNVLFERDSERRLCPASNQKLLASLFFVDTCGWSPLPPTKFWRQDNSIVVQSSGDPTLSLDKLRSAAKALGGPVPTVKLVQTFRPGFHPNWEYDDMPNRYGAAITAFGADGGAFQFKIVNGKILPLLPSARIKIVRQPTANPLSVHYDLFGGKLYVTGKILPTTQYSENFAYLAPDRVAAGLFGRTAVDIQESDLPNRPSDLSIAPDDTEAIIRHCLVESDNTFAENLLLIAAGKSSSLDPIKPWPEATDRLAKWLSDKVGWAGPEPILDDGSGLSRHNGVTSRGIVSLLAWVRRQPWFDRYASCLPAPGDGTLKGRLEKSTFRGKTGTLSGVVALSGFLTEKTAQKPLIFSIIVNQSARNTQFTRSIVDKLAVALENGALHDSFSSPAPFQSVHGQGFSDPSHSAAPGNRNSRSGFDRLTAPRRTYR